MGVCEKGMQLHLHTDSHLYISGNLHTDSHLLRAKRTINVVACVHFYALSQLWPPIKIP